MGPFGRVSDEAVYNLNIDWIKLYDVAQLTDYPGLRVLYRMDIRPHHSMAEFRREIVHRTEEIAPKGVDAIEVGNEPNLILEWHTGPDPAEFAQYLCVAYEAIKSVAPHIVVVSGGLAPAPSLPDGSAVNDLVFANGMLSAGAGGCFDAFGYHPYGFNLPPEASPYDYEYGFRRVERIRELLVEHKLRDKQIWLTEYGWLYSSQEQGVNCEGHPEFQGYEWLQVPMSAAADFVPRALTFADENWHWAGPTFLWNLDWQLSDMDQCNQMRWFGLLNRDGTPNAIYHRFANAPRRYSDYEPILSTWTEDMTEIVEAYCPDDIKIGEFQVLNTGYPVPLQARIEPVQGAGIPLTYVSREAAQSGQKIDVFVETGNVEPGLHMVVVNVVMFRHGRRVSTNVRGWVLAQPPTSQECVANAEAVAGAAQ